MNLSKRNWAIILVAVTAVTLFAAFGMNRKPQPKFFTSRVERGDIRATVEATGTINAVTTVQVGSQVSGIISRLNADFNSSVKRGQVIAQIDPSIFEATLLQAKADLENAKANLAVSRANLERSRATAVQTKADYERTLSLSKQGVLSQQQLDLARANAESAEAQVSASQAQIAQAAAQVSQRSAAVQVAQTNLEHTTIIAPIDGIVVNRSVDVGQTVAASLQAPTLFTIAQDLTKMLVYTKTDESDIGRIQPGQPVTFKVDAFPNETFHGKVQQVRLNATTVQNVVTYDTVIEFENPERKLFPGMTAYVTIPVASARDVLRISNSALRFKPDMKPEEVQALYQKYGIKMGGRGPNRIPEESGLLAQTTEETASAPDSGDAAKPKEQNDSTSRAGRGEFGNRPEAGEAGGIANRRNRGDFANRGEGAGRWPRATNGTGGGQRPNLAKQAPGQGQRQGPTPAEMEARHAQMAVVWKLNPDQSLQPVRVRTGITDFTLTEILAGDLREGDLLITGSESARAGGGGPPRFGGTPGGGGGRR